MGLENIPRRMLQAARQRSGWLKGQLAPERFSDSAFRAATRLDESTAAALWRQAAERLWEHGATASRGLSVPQMRLDAQLLGPCRRALNGDYLHFGHWYAACGWPPEFNRDALHGIDWPTSRHWTEFARSAPPRDDIKLLWEPSRLSLGFSFARAYAHTGDTAWAEAWWTLFDAWVEQNPAQLTGNWACGQENALRLLVMVFAGSVTADADVATSERLYGLVRYIWQCGRHIETNINYALSQKNNHGVSEAVGLWTAGLLLGDGHEAKRWRRKGMSALEKVSYMAMHAGIALSPGIREGMLRRCAKGKNVAMIPNGCDLELFQPLPSRPSVTGKFRAVFTGAHGIANGLDAVLDAALELKRRDRTDIELTFIGDGKLKPQLQSRAKAEGLDQCVFLDPVPKNRLAAMLPEFDVGLMILANVPAFYYGTSPNKFFDYLASGLPVLNNYPGWLAELIDKHECGLAVGPDDPVAFADALIRLADRPEERAGMGQNARRLAEGLFSRTKLAREFVDFLQNVAAS